MSSLVVDSTHPAHLAAGVCTLNCGLLGLYAFSSRTMLMLEMNWATASCTFYIHCYETSVSGMLLCIYACIPCMCMIFPLIFAEIMKSSSIQGWMHTLRTASLCPAASNYSFSALSHYILASRWVRTTVYAVPQTLSYCFWSSHSFLFNCWMLGSSSRVVRTSSVSSSIWVQFHIALPIFYNLAVIALTCCSLTFGGVEGCTFNRSLVIWRFSSSWTLVASSLASQTTVGNL